MRYMYARSCCCRGTLLDAIHSVSLTSREFQRTAQAGRVAQGFQPGPNGKVLRSVFRAQKGCRGRGPIHPNLVTRAVADCTTYTPISRPIDRWVRNDTYLRRHCTAVPPLSWPSWSPTRSSRAPGGATVERFDLCHCTAVPPLSWPSWSPRRSSRATLQRPCNVRSARCTGGCTALFRVIATFSGVLLRACATVQPEARKLST